MQHIRNHLNHHHDFHAEGTPTVLHHHFFRNQLHQHDWTFLQGYDSFHRDIFMGFKQEVVNTTSQFGRRSLRVRSYVSETCVKDQIKETKHKKKLLTDLSLQTPWCLPFLCYSSRYLRRLSVWMKICI